MGKSTIHCPLPQHECGAEALPIPRHTTLQRFTPAVVNKPAPVPPNFWGWLPSCLYYEEGAIIRESGLDTAIYLRLINYVGGAPCAACPGGCSWIWSLQLVPSCACWHSTASGMRQPASIWIAAFTAPQGLKLFSILTVWLLLTVLPTNWSVSDGVVTCSGAAATGLPAECGCVPEEEVSWPPRAFLHEQPLVTLPHP